AAPSSSTSSRRTSAPKLPPWRASEGVGRPGMSMTGAGAGTHGCGLRWWGWMALAIVWLLTIQIRPMLDPDEGPYAEILPDRLTTVNWLTPRLDGLTYFEKPALQYWATAA